MLSRRWRARLGVFAAFSLGSLSIASLAVRSAEHRRLLRAYFAGRPPGTRATPAHVANHPARPADALPDVSSVARSLPRPPPPR